MLNRLTPLFMCSCLSLTTYTAAASNDIFSLESGLGIDDNAFQFNDELEDTQTDIFLKNTLKAKFKTGNFTLRAKLTDVSYQDIKEADSLSSLISAKYQIKFNKQQKLYLGLGFDHFDGTFVSRFSGDVYSFNDTDAGDRYDYHRITPSLTYLHKFNKQHRLITQLKYQTKDYDDFTKIGLSDLDYDQVSAKLSWRYKPQKTWSVTPYVELSKRDYDNRLAKSVSGANIQGLGLEYDDTKFGLSLKKQFSDKWSVVSKISFDKREDNASGYYNRDKKGVSIALKHKQNKHQFGQISVNYSKLDYNDTSSSADQDSENITPSRDGWRFKAQYQWPIMKLANNELILHAEAQYNTFDSMNEYYSYDQTVGLIGLKYSF